MFQYAKLARDLKLGGDSVEPTSKAKTTDVNTATKQAKEPTKVATKDLKKNLTELADIRSQLFTKSTGEKTSSKMPKPRNAYKSPPEEKSEQPTAEPRGLEEISAPPLKEQDKQEEPMNVEEKEGVEDQGNMEPKVEDQGGNTEDQAGEDQGGNTEDQAGEDQGGNTEDNIEDEEDEPLDIN